MGSSQITLLVIIIPLTLLSITTSLWTLRVTRRKMQALGESVAPWGWHVMTNAGQLEHRWRGHPFSGGFYRRAGLNVTGAYQGRSAVVFEYNVVTVHRFVTLTATVLAAPGRYAGLELTVLDREEELTRRSAGDDVLTGSPEFDAVWRVRSTDPQRALEILQPHVRALLLEPDAGPLRITDGEILTWREGTIRLRKVHETLAWLARVDELLATPAPDVQARPGTPA